MFDYLQPHGLLQEVHGILQARITGVGSRSLLQGIFPTQGSNPGLLHCRWILYHLSHQGNFTLTAHLSSDESHLQCSQPCAAGGCQCEWRCPAAQ